MKRFALVGLLALAAASLAYAAVDKSVIKEMETISDKCKSLSREVGKEADNVEKTYVQIEKVLDQWKSRDKVGDVEKKIFEGHFDSVMKKTKELEEKVKDLTEQAKKLEKLSDKLAR